MKSVLLDKQFIFIIGAPRSGTTWLQAMIGAHPLVATTVELTLFSKYISPWMKAWKEEATNMARGRWYQGLPFLWAEEEFHGFLIEFLEKVYGKVAATEPQATHILDKHPAYSQHVEEIKTLVKDALFIHLIRDGRDVAVSMLAARQQVGFGTDNILDSAAVWKDHVRKAQRAEQYGKRYMEVRYENLLVCGSDLLKSVFDFCGVPASREEAAAIFDAHRFERMKAKRITPVKGVKAPRGAYGKGKLGGWADELEPVERCQFDRMGGDLLRELGYAEEGWWAQSEREKVLLPVLAAILRRKQVIKRAVLDLLPGKLAARIINVRGRSGNWP